MSEPHIISKDLTKTDWSVSRDSFLLDKLIEQTSLGRRGENGWTKEAWNIIANAFNLNFRVRHSKQQLKSRFNLLRKQYRYVRMLQQQSGFVWDDRFKILTADNEVWDRYICEHPDAKLYRNKRFLHYDKLALLLEAAEGRDHLLTLCPEPLDQRSAPSTPHSPVISASPFNDVREDVDERNSSSEEEEDDLPPERSWQPRKRRSVTPSSMHDNKRSRESVEVRRTATNGGESLMVSSDTHPIQMSPLANFSWYNKCLVELQAMKELDQNEKVKAVKILGEEKWAVAFMTLRGTLRVAWLRSMMNEG
ncbi:L10-interacting MYB domain-containing protein [Cinnamomum micranthum f. kanehirae]|uniref:L10-interacting MYB domain-containing protein n=1 Tax=Cinnamomum micranthum f. kanehirae TaxID=337451 RepID=A0A3S3N3D7_9MAGN|nr:L10-interacting MYB domain-containing protein [Cinnamomum micranthum f. kanehirae]